MQGINAALHSLLTLVLHVGETTSHPRCFSPGKRAPQHPLNWRPGGPPKKILNLPTLKTLDHQALSPAATSTTLSWIPLNGLHSFKHYTHFYLSNNLQKLPVVQRPQVRGNAGLLDMLHHQHVLFLSFFLSFLISISVICFVSHLY